MKLAAATALFVSGVVAASTAAAAAHQSQPQPRNGANQPSTFSGSCALSGTVQFQPPLTNTPQTVRDLARARGTCSGTLTDSRGQTRQLNATTVSYFATDAGSEVSCGLTPGATGTGELVFQSAKLRFNLSETRLAAAAELTLNGTRGGSASGEANVNAGANPVQIAEACMAGGLAEAPVDLHIQTTPTISG